MQFSLSFKRMPSLMNDTIFIGRYSEWSDDLMRNADDSTLSPTVVEIHITVGYGLCCLLFGLPLNVHAANCVARERNLLENGSDEPFNNLLMARIFSAVFTLFAMVVEMISGLSTDDDGDQEVDDATLLCRFNVLLTGLPYLLYLFNLFLSLVHHCKPRNFHKLFQPHVIASLNLSLALAVNWLYVVGGAPLRCAYQKTHVATLAATLFLLYFPCVILTVFVHLKQRCNQSAVSGNAAAIHNINNSGNVESRSKRRRRMKRTFVVTGVSLNLLLPIPLIFILLLHFISLPFRNAEQQQGNGPFLFLAAYFYKFVLLHVFIDALVYLHVSSGINSI